MIARIGFAAKMNLLKQNDPLMARELYADISEKYRNENRNCLLQLKEQQTKLGLTTDIL